MNAEKFAQNYRQRIIETFNQVALESIAKVAQVLHEAKENGKAIYFFGNGGSHSIATHLACDFAKGTKNPNKQGQKLYKAISLDNPAQVTAYGNDGPSYFTQRGLPGQYAHGYDGVFVGQLENLLEEGDVAFGISSSGNSPNVVNALLYAKQIRAITVAMVGFDGGQAAKTADHAILVPTPKGEYGIVEGLHEVIHHLLYDHARKLEGL